MNANGMTVKRRVLITGAAGRLGACVFHELVQRGHDVRATDVKFRHELGTQLQLGDLRDELFVYRALQGCDAVVHLGNHPNRFAGPSPQRLLAENVAMNSNVLLAAVDLGVRDILFASSVQVMLRTAGYSPPPYALPYLPLDGDAPADPGMNPYAMSKDLCERTLALLCKEQAGLSATSLRFPMLLDDEQLQRLRQRGPVSPFWLNFGEALAILSMRDAAQLIAAMLDRRVPGYRQYFPALSWELDMSVREVIERHYPEVPRRQPLESIERLIDLSELEQRFGWTPRDRVRVEIERRLSDDDAVGSSAR